MLTKHEAIFLYVTLARTESREMQIRFRFDGIDIYIDGQRSKISPYKHSAVGCVLERNCKKCIFAILSVICPNVTPRE